MFEVRSDMHWLAYCFYQPSHALKAMQSDPRVDTYIGYAFMVRQPLKFYTLIIHQQGIFL